MTENELKTGEIYETVIQGKDVGKGVYLGKTPKMAFCDNIIVYRDETKNVRMWRFSDYLRNSLAKVYNFKNGKLEISSGWDRDLPRSEQEYLEQRLKMAGF